LTSSHTARENVIVEGDAKQRVAVVPIITDLMLEAQADQFEKMMTAVEKDDTVKALVLKIDTPGGAVTAADEIHHRIELFKTRKPGVPVVVTMGSLAASGGYYAACAADYLVAEPTTITGSIGVLMESINISKLAEKYGVEDTSLHATGADFKTAGSWMKPVNDRDTQYFISMLDSDFAKFKDVVTTGRGSKLTEPINTIANGKAYTADEALKLGLVDQLGYAPDAYNYVESKLGKSNMEVVQFEQPSSLMELLSSSKSNVLPGEARGGVQFNAVNIDAGKLNEMLTPRMMYLWRGE